MGNKKIKPKNLLPYRVLTDKKRRPRNFFMLQHFKNDVMVYLCSTDAENKGLLYYRFDNTLMPWIALAHTKMPIVSFDMDDNGNIIDQDNPAPLRDYSHLA